MLVHSFLFVSAFVVVTFFTNRLVGRSCYLLVKPVINQVRLSVSFVHHALSLQSAIITWAAECLTFMFYLPFAEEI